MSREVEDVEGGLHQNGQKRLKTKKKPIASHACDFSTMFFKARAVYASELVKEMILKKPAYLRVLCNAARSKACKVY
ncbi:jg20795 [Pararge aegeria aegeria]|uniref:Jg20795 protein n=1 Tax=Pararge aegeria aegeria TaxID=348720 RepID=A0A8S4R5Q5_9NEOP|nr:jg20795 [Pararge aegeria aegeria]